MSNNRGKWIRIYSRKSWNSFHPNKLRHAIKPGRCERLYHNATYALEITLVLNYVRPQVQELSKDLTTQMRSVATLYFNVSKTRKDIVNTEPLKNDKKSQDTSMYTPLLWS